VQEVLQADWHEFAHSLQPGLQRLFLMFVLLIVFMCFMSNPPIKKIYRGNYSTIFYGNKAIIFPFKNATISLSYYNIATLKKYQIIFFIKFK